MNIISIETKRVDLKLLHPFTVALGTITALPTLLIKIETEDGYTGYGESSPISFVTGETLDSVEFAIKSLATQLIGMDSSCIEKIHDAMDRMFRENNCAKAGIDIALFDILAKRANLPLYKYLGGSKSDFEVDKTITIGPIEDMAKDALKVKSEGFNIVKVKLGLDPTEDVKRIAAIREAVGPDMKIRIDANQGWNKVDAIKAINAMEKYDVQAIEQPLKYWDLAGHKLVREKTMIPLMADESLFSPMDAINIVRDNSFDIFNIKLMKCGGLYNATKINSIGQAAGYECMLGCMLESSIAITAAASFIASKTNVTYADIDSTFHIHPTEGIYGGVEFKDGRAFLNEKPGLGIEVKW